jgi:asparagine synthase (glutamine-hydrolysing)
MREKGKIERMENLGNGGNSIIEAISFSFFFSHFFSWDCPKKGEDCMCSLSAIYFDDRQLLMEEDREKILETMSDTMTLRGPDGKGFYQGEGICLGHNRLAVMDPQRGAQPMRATFNQHSCVLVYNGEIYNSFELRKELSARGATFSTDCDTETVLWAYLLFGDRCPVYLNGIFAFVVWDETDHSLFFARDRLGVKPLYYTQLLGREEFLFSSEIKGLLAHPAVKPIIDQQGLWQLLFLSPVTLPQSTVFKGIFSVLPGQCGRVREGKLETSFYWTLQAKPCTDSKEEAACRVRELVGDALHRQLFADVPLCTFLSGGLDSSALTALAAEEYRKQGKILSTYSFEYAQNRENFHKSLFQPASDDDFAPRLAGILQTDHQILTASEKEVADLLSEAAFYRDLPGQADIDSSLLFYCRQIKKRHTVALSGECADEIFGGYPWFYRPEMLERDFFPWVHDPFVRSSLFVPEVARAKEGKEWLSSVYRDQIAATPLLGEESPEDRRAKIATHLSTTFFMANLLERKDRMSMAASLEVRVPFSDHRILEYVYNLPWKIKFEGGVEKAVLRNALKGVLPEEFRMRKKSPYPKTHSPKYEVIVRQMLEKELKKDSLFCQIINRKEVDRLLCQDQDSTWMGQLMARPQLIGWLYQFATFLEGKELSL